MWACETGHHVCAQALIDAGAAVDMVDNAGLTALMWACRGGYRACVQALLDAGAAVDVVKNAGKTALMEAVESPSLDAILVECAAENDEDEDSDDDSDMDEEELEQRFEERRQQRFERKLNEKRQGRAWCVQALLEAMAPIQGADCRERATSFKFACDRIRVLAKVVAASHVIEHASVLAVEARVVILTANAQGTVTEFARAELAS